MSAKVSPDFFEPHWKTPSPDELLVALESRVRDLERQLVVLRLLVEQLLEEEEEDDES